MLEDSMEQLAEAENRAEDLSKQLGRAKAARKRAETRLERVMEEIRRAKTEKVASYDDDAATDISTLVPLPPYSTARASRICFAASVSLHSDEINVPHDSAAGTASRILPRVLRSSSRLRLWQRTHLPKTCAPRQPSNAHI